jgi:phosphoribosylamine--glycine ligase
MALRGAVWRGNSARVKVLVVGSGAREHALAWKLAGDSGVTEVICAPGNAGTGRVACNVACDPSDVAAVVALARREAVGLVVVGPEAPLVAGVVDALGDAGILAYGPSRAAARLEGSKAFSKELMARAGVPTAAFRTFDDADAASAYVREAARPLVVKADGLAAGKGVVVAADTAEALDAIDRFMRRRDLGDAGARVVIEECLRGPEVSYHVIADGERFVPLAPAQDHKRALDGDRGPNTGGMGAYSPPPMVTAAVRRALDERVVAPTLRAMRDAGAPFRGTLFVGAMIVDGAPSVLEYNVRFGDPECECIVTRWRGDLLPALVASARGDVSSITPSWDAPCSMCVVLAAPGYPGAYEKSIPIDGLDAAERVRGVTVFHAGTAVRDGRLVSTGGRVLTVTAVGASIDDAAARAYEAAGAIRMPGAHFRKDIGWQARTK